MDLSDTYPIARALVRTPGKIIISGEHSVVYHKPALVMAINLYTTARLSIYPARHYHFLISSAATKILEYEV